MSIHIVGMQEIQDDTGEINQINFTLRDIFAVTGSIQPKETIIANIALVGLQSMIAKECITFGKEIDELVVGRIHASHGGILATDSLTLARHGFREITSTWAKAKFPKATHEISVTLIDEDDRAAHVFLIYV